MFRVMRWHLLTDFLVWVCPFLLGAGYTTVMNCGPIEGSSRWVQSHSWPINQQRRSSSFSNWCQFWDQARKPNIMEQHWMHVHAHVCMCMQNQSDTVMEFYWTGNKLSWSFCFLIHLGNANLRYLLPAYIAMTYDPWLFYCIFYFLTNSDVNIAGNRECEGNTQDSWVFFIILRFACCLISLK